MHASIRRWERARREGYDHREGTQVKVTKDGWSVILLAAGPRGAGGRGEEEVRTAVRCTYDDRGGGGGGGGGGLVDLV